MLTAAPTIAFAEVFRPEPLDRWSRSSEDVDKGRGRDAEGLIDGSMSWVEVSNGIAGEDDDVLDLDVINPIVLDLAVRLGMVYPAAS